MSGFFGKILRVDLTKSNITDETIPEDWVMKFIGGRGLAVRYLIEEIPNGANPLGPENLLIFMTGPLTGMVSPSACRYSVVGKSPLTGILAQCSSGGYFAPRLKKTGFDGIIFQGASPKPVYLVIDEGEAHLRDAEHLWGKNVSETTRIIQEELSEEFKVSCIGIAGENLVKYAAIMNDQHRAAGRCGLGAVMGSKQLKAIAVKGTKALPIADKLALKESEKSHYHNVNESTTKLMFYLFGSANAIARLNILGFLPHKNWQSSYMQDADEISGVAISETILTDRKPCFACPVKCGRVWEIKEGKYAGSKGEGLHYQSVTSLGSMVSINDIEVVAVANMLCDDYGLDTISCGSSIAFAMECYEKGIITKEETGGMDITFGNADAVLELIGEIARRKGIGDLLAEGTRIMAKSLGKGTEKFAMQVKGLEIPYYDPRASKIMGLAYAVASRGACHLMSCIQVPSMSDVPLLIVDCRQFFPDSKIVDLEDVFILKEMEDACAWFDCIGGCKFLAFASTYDDWIAAIRNVTGQGFTLEGLKKVGERVCYMERTYNVREGITRSDDTLPKRLLEEPLTEGSGEGHVAELDIYLDPYYNLRGWDSNGIPTSEKLRDLDLADLVQFLP